MATKEEARAMMEATRGGRIIPVQVDGWKLLHVKKLLVSELSDDDADADDEPKLALKEMYARSAARVLCTDDGQRIYDWRNKDDVALLMEQELDSLRQIVVAAQGKAGNSQGAGSSSTN